MSDTPSQKPDDSQDRTVRRVTWIGLVANVLLSVAKFVAGVFGHSQALVADAVHTISDTTTDVAILVGMRYWNRPADESHPHGHRRIETLVTLGIGVALLLVAVGLAWDALSSLRRDHPSAPSPGWIALAAALVSIAGKEILYRWSVAAGRRVKSYPVIANAWHHRSDAFSSIPVAVAVAGTQINPSWAFLDHVGAAVVCVFILHAAWRISWPALNKLLDAGAPVRQREQIGRLARATSGVKDVHGIRTRYVGCASLAVDLHVLVAPNMSVHDGHEIARAVKSRLLTDVDEVVDVVVHVEPYEGPDPGA